MQITTKPASDSTARAAIVISTTIPIHFFHNKKLRKHLLPFLEMMLNGISVRKTAENLEISPTIVHSWRHAVLHYIEKNCQAFMGKLPSDEIIESSISEFKPSRKGLPAHSKVPASTQVIRFQCNRQNQFYLTLQSEGGIKRTNQLIKWQSSVHFNGATVDSFKTSPADHLLHHSRHVQELHEQFADAYQPMRGVA